MWGGSWLATVATLGMTWDYSDNCYTWGDISSVTIVTLGIIPILPVCSELFFVTKKAATNWNACEHTHAHAHTHTHTHRENPEKHTHWFQLILHWNFTQRKKMPRFKRFNRLTINRRTEHKVKHEWSKTNIVQCQFYVSSSPHTCISLVHTWLWSIRHV